MGITESKIEMTDRLRYEGLWTEACVYRDKVRRRLRAEGMSRQEAGHTAWQAVQQRYPSEDPPQVKALQSLLVSAFFGPSAHGDTGQQKEFLAVWFALHLVESLAQFRDVPREHLHLARHRFRKMPGEDAPNGGFARFVLAILEPTEFRVVAEKTFREQLEMMDEEHCERRYVQDALHRIDIAVTTTAEDAA